MLALDPSRRSPRCAVAASVALMLVAACARDGGAPADSALARDLTLASSAAGHPHAATPVVFADTTVGPAPSTPAPETSPPAATTRPARVADAPTVVRRQPRPRPEPDAPPLPAPTDAAPTPAPTPTTAAPAPAAAPAAGSGRELRAGAGLALSLASAVCSATNRPGDKFVATLTQPITAPDGTTLLATGTNVVLELTAASPATGDHAHVELAVRGVTIDGFFRPLPAQVADADAQLERHRYENPNGTSTSSKVGRGAMAGAILGRILGGSTKGAVIGAAAGAAAGAATGMASLTSQGCLPAGAPLRARVAETVSL